MNTIFTVNAVICLKVKKALSAPFSISFAFCLVVFFVGLGVTTSKSRGYGVRITISLVSVISSIA